MKTKCEIMGVMVVVDNTMASDHASIIPSGPPHWRDSIDTYFRPGEFRLCRICDAIETLTLRGFVTDRVCMNEETLKELYHEYKGIFRTVCED